MIRNKEYGIFLVIQLIFYIMIGVISNHRAVWLCGGCLILMNLTYSWWRYKRMEELAFYLHRLQNESVPIEFHHIREGELSILESEIHKLSQKLNHQTELLQKDKLYLADAISDISHQLKTPLTSMMMMAELLATQTLSEEKELEFIHNIQVGVERMQWLVQSLLKISKLDAGAVELKQDSVSMKQLIKKSVEAFLIPMEMKQQSFCIDDREDVSFLGDLNWCTEAISNIVKNCMEHTSEGGTIGIRYGDNNFYTTIVIEDNGTGISKEDLPHIFERFYKGKSASKESVGIGLALSKAIITRQKGTIQVESKVGEGTRFTIKFYR